MNKNPPRYNPKPASILSLLHAPNLSHQLRGWFPIYDTFRGICGDIHLSMKLELFRNVNEFRESSTSVLFFSAMKLPVVSPSLVCCPVLLTLVGRSLSGLSTGDQCYVPRKVFGFVEELIVNDDPEYQVLVRCP